MNNMVEIDSIKAVIVDSTEETNINPVETITIDSLKRSLNEHSMKFSSVEERLAKMDGDLAKSIKIKFSGNLQSTYEIFDYNSIFYQIDLQQRF